MKICAIIAEYNPFHNGHKYQIEQAKKISNADAVLILMSGDFVQRAQGAIFNKYLRAKAALCNGADFVFELPAIIATSCGQIFAEGAINILNNFKDIEYLCFGCEDNDLEQLNKIADIQLNENNNFKSVLKQNLKDGQSYANSYDIATKTSDLSITSHTMCDITRNKPNNLLAIEYIKALKKTNSKIKPLAITRIGSDYNSDTTKEQFISASGARKLFYENDIATLENFIPGNIIQEFTNEFNNHKFNCELFDSIVILALRNNNLSDLLDSNGILENKLQANSFMFLSLNKLILSVKSKCFSYSRIRRICLQALLGITKELGENYKSCATRLLGIKEQYRQYIGELPPIVKIKNNDILTLSGVEKELSDIDKRASNIYSLLTNKTGNQFYENKIIIN